MNCVLGWLKRGVMDITVAWKTPHRDICQRDGKWMTTPLVMNQHVPVDIATTVHMMTGEADPRLSLFVTIFTPAGSDVRREWLVRYCC